MAAVRKFEFVFGNLGNKVVWLWKYEAIMLLLRRIYDMVGFIALKEGALVWW
jgi:hypothetical protein